MSENRRGGIFWLTLYITHLWRPLYTTQKASNAKYSKRELPSFSHLLWHLARKRDGPTTLPSPHGAFQHQEDIRKQTSISSTIQSAG